MLVRMVSLAVAGLLLLSGPSPARACLVAHQVRTVVLGGVGDEVLVLRIEQVRDGDLETGNEWFFLTPSLVAVAFGPDGTVRKETVLQAWPEQRVTAADAQAHLHSLFDTAATRARAREGFVAATIDRRVRCDYLSRCGEYRVVAEGLLGPRERRLRVVTPTLLHDPITDFAAAGVGIDGVDVVHVGKRRVALVTIGTGWDQDPCAHAAGPCTDDRALRAEPTPATVRAGLTHRRGLHHGREWDVLVRH